MKKGQGKAIIIILLVIIAVVLIVIAFKPSISGNATKEVNEEVKEPETFKINLTINHILSLLDDRDVDYLVGREGGIEIICLKACGKQCVSLGYTYKSSLFILSNVENADEETINTELKENNAGMSEWLCSCECNK